jgi:hypothetical protein
MSDWCVESVSIHLYTSYRTYVWRLYGHICTQGIRLMCGVCMDTSVHRLLDWCVKSLWTHMYTRCHTDLWILYGNICTPVVRLIYGVCIVTSVLQIYDWCVDSRMKISAHKLSDWCVEYAWTQFYTICQTDVWSLYSDNCTQDIRLMCGVCMDKFLFQLYDWSVESV